MGANTEMSRLDSIPTEKLNDILGLDTDTLGEIPAPESTDEGKVLGVADGAYALVSGGGGGGAEPLIVTVTKTTGAEKNTYTADKTYNEIKGAVEAGQNVIISYEIVDEGNYTTAAKSMLGGLYEQEFDSEEPTAYVILYTAMDTLSIMMLGTTDPTTYPVYDEYIGDGGGF